MRDTASESNQRHRGAAGVPMAGGEGGEFDLIRRMQERWGSLAHGIGDDAAVLRVPAGEQLVVSTDSTFERVHFRREWLSAREIGYRAGAAALSDLAAMAARPLGMLVAIGLTEGDREIIDEIADGFGEAAQFSGAPIVGGNISAASELSLTTTVVGSAAEPLGRSGARVDDILYVTGRLGGVGAAIVELTRKGVPEAEHLGRFAHPVPRILEAHWLAARGAHAMIDVSDGLASDVAHLAAASGVRIILELDRLPLMDGVSPVEGAQSGEEYELAFTAPASADLSAFASDFELPVTAIGRVVSGAPGVDARLGGERVDLPRGYEHLSE